MTELREFVQPKVGILVGQVYIAHGLPWQMLCPRDNEAECKEKDVLKIYISTGQGKSTLQRQHTWH